MSERKGVSHPSHVIGRRLFLGHLFAACAAPAIVRASSLMPVKALDPILFARNPWWTSYVELSDELLAVTRKAFLPRLEAQLYTEAQTFSMLINEQLYSDD
jgi:hypothetical protein